MFVAKFVDKQDDVSDLRNHILLSPGVSETTSGVFLSPERTEHGESYIPLGYLMLNQDFSIDFISRIVSEP